MEINEYTKPQGQFLKAKDVEASPTKMFVPLEEGTMVENEKFGGQRLHVKGEMDGAEFTFDMSKTNSRIVAEKLGTETKQWVGKRFALEIYKVKVSSGDFVNAINVAGVEVPAQGGVSPPQ
jgi:hypothetical protein|tara:strand:+ start:23785 stop:24147 length:363 start_codon:yes stop_codon:yes gene_type:complete